MISKVVNFSGISLTASRKLRGCRSFPSCNRYLGKMSGQSVVDRLNAAKHSLSGQGLAKAICKASTEEVNGPKRKHLDCKIFSSFSAFFKNYLFPIEVIQ